MPFPVYNYDTEQARASMRKLAALEPAAAWPGHAKPLTGDVRAQLERAADAAGLSVGKRSRRRTAGEAKAPRAAEQRLRRRARATC